MLDKLFGSNARVKLLKLFFLHPQQRFYIREVARQLKLPLNSVFRELNNLEEIGLLATENIPESDSATAPALDLPIGQSRKVKEADKKQDKKYYRLNQDFIFFNEIQSLIIKSQMLYEKDFTDQLKKTGAIKLLVLSGVFVNNLEAPVDLLIVGDCNRRKLANTVSALEDELVKDINYTVMNQDEFAYRREITDMFLYNILDGEKIVVIDEDNIL